MSTKIYKGFVIDTNSLPDILARVRAFRPWAQEQAQLRLEDFIRNVALGDPAAGWDMWQDIRERMHTKGRKVPGVDTEFSLVFIPDGDRCLGIAYVLRSEWFASWLAQPGVFEYSYWDNVDAPEGMSPQDWSERGAAWERVCGDAPVSQCGFAIEVTDPHGPVPRRIQGLPAV